MALQASSLLPSTFSKGKASATLKNSSIFGASLSDYTKSDFGSSSFRVKNQRRSSNGGVVRATMVASPGVTTNSPSGKKNTKKRLCNSHWCLIRIRLSHSKSSV